MGRRRKRNEGGNGTRKGGRSGKEVNKQGEREEEIEQDTSSLGATDSGYRDNSKASLG